MGKITDIPEEVSDAGQDRDYNSTTLWTVTLVNAPMDPAYENVIGLGHIVVHNYIEDEIRQGRHFTFELNNQDPYGPFDIPVPQWQLREYNYARVSYGAPTPFGSNTMYFFVETEYLTAATARCIPTPDYWTMYAPTLGYSKVVRGHAAVAAAARVDGNRYTLEPEPISPPELTVVKAWEAGKDKGTDQVWVFSTTDLTADPFTTTSLYAPSTQGAVQTDFSAEMSRFNSSMRQGDDLDPGTGNWAISNRWSGPIPGGGSWPFPSEDGIAISGMPIEVDPRNHPWKRNINEKLPTPNPDSHGARAGLGWQSSWAQNIDNIPQTMYIFRYDNPGAFTAHMSALAHAPWVVKGIQSAFIANSAHVRDVQLYTSAGTTYLQPTRTWSPDNTVIGGFTGFAPTRILSVKFSASITEALGDWRGYVRYGSYRKLEAPQYTELVLSDRNGGELVYNTANAPANISFRADVTSRDVATKYGWLDVPGASESPLEVTTSKQLGRPVNGFSEAFYQGAVSHDMSRTLAQQRWFNDIQQHSYARYGSLAQDGFPTVLQREIGKALTGGF